MRDTGDPSRVLLWLLVALILAFAILGVIMSFALGWRGFGMMGMGFGWMGFVMAIPVLVLVLILLAVLGTFDRTYDTKKTALETLGLRLARGEIPIEEYERVKGELLK